MMRSDAYRAFKKCLFDGELRPGQFVSQRELAELLDLPLNPIREAIRQLDSEGLIRVYPQRGIQIIEADPKTVNDAHDYRLLLERAAIVGFARHAPEATVQRMRAETEKILQSLARKPVDRPENRKALEAAVEAAWNFHEEIIDFQGNAIISHHYRLNSARIRLFRSATYRNTISEQIVPALGQHLRVLDACQRRDAEEAARFIAEDIEASRSITLGLRAA
jgi:DNA-binding GntR family transcriptional regulator